MATFEVRGGTPLCGEITPQGAKNEALQVICATLLTPEKVTIRNIPAIVDVMQLIELLRRMAFSSSGSTRALIRSRPATSISIICKARITASEPPDCAVR